MAAMGKNMQDAMKSVGSSPSIKTAKPSAAGTNLAAAWQAASPKTLTRGISSAVERGAEIAAGISPGLSQADVDENQDLAAKQAASEAAYKEGMLGVERGKNAILAQEAKAKVKTPLASGYSDPGAGNETSGQGQGNSSAGSNVETPPNAAQPPKPAEKGFWNSLGDWVRLKGTSPANQRSNLGG